MNKTPYDILVKPVITEKTMRAAGESSEYTFEVDLKANKHEIKWAAETAYGVQVVDVTTSVLKGKSRVSRMRNIPQGKRADVKKAYVKLAEGQEIELV